MPAARAATLSPASVEPMNPTTDVRGSPAMASPTTEPGPVTRLKTPAGRSASARQAARTVAQSDVFEAGFQTTVLPAARAGAMSSPGIVYGQFQGVMMPTTPRGTR